MKTRSVLENSNPLPDASHAHCQRCTVITGIVFAILLVLGALAASNVSGLNQMGAKVTGLLLGFGIAGVILSGTILWQTCKLQTTHEESKFLSKEDVVRKVFKDLAIFMEMPFKKIEITLDFSDNVMKDIIIDSDDDKNDARQKIRGVCPNFSYNGCAYHLHMIDIDGNHHHHQGVVP